MEAAWGSLITGPLGFVRRSEPYVCVLPHFYFSRYPYNTKRPIVSQMPKSDASRLRIVSAITTRRSAEGGVVICGGGGGARLIAHVSTPRWAPRRGNQRSLGAHDVHSNCSINLVEKCAGRRHFRSPIGPFECETNCALRSS